MSCGLTARSVAARVSNPTRSASTAAAEPVDADTVSGRPVTSASDAPTRVSAVAVRSCSCTSPGCRVEADVSSPRPYDGPLATTARGRTGDTPSPTPATMTSAPASTARTCATSASSRSRAAVRSAPDSGSVPPSTRTTGQLNEPGSVGPYVVTTPLGSAPPIAAPGPTVSTHAPDAVTPSPSVPGCASYEPAAAAARYSSQRGTRSATTGNGSRHGPATSAARRPADTVSHPSTAHDRLRTARTVIDPTAPSAAMACTAGRSPPSTSDHDSPGAPTTTSRGDPLRGIRRARTGHGRPGEQTEHDCRQRRAAPHPCTSSCRAITTRAAVHASGATAAGRPS